VRINTNVSALNAWKNLGITDTFMSKSLEKLSSGFRINRAADDAAGLAISEKMRAQISGLRQAARNAQDGISMIQTAEGALNETHSILQRMRELVVQGGTGTNTDEDLDKINAEMAELVGELDGIAGRTEFNGLSLLNGTLGAEATNLGSNLAANGSGFFTVSSIRGAASGTYTVTTTAAHGANDAVTVSSGGVSQSISVANIESVTPGAKFHFDKLGITLTATAKGDLKNLAANNTFDIVAQGAELQIGANGGGQSLMVNVAAMNATALGVNGVDVKGDFDTQLGAIDGAITKVSDQRSTLGAYQNRLEHTINNLNTSAENLAAAESRIRDVDMALEMATFTRHQILLQAGTAMLAQANMKPQSVLKLLG